MDGQAIIISYDELKILLYNRGYRFCEGILMPDNEISDEEVLRAMNKLALRGMIIAKEDSFAISHETAQMVDLIGRPNSSYSFSDEKTGQVFCCYLSDEMVVVTENYWKRPDTLRIRIFTPEEFRIWREESE